MAIPTVTSLYNGAPNAGGVAYVYQTGTTTPISIYSNATLVTSLPNPVTLDVNGQVTFYTSGAVNIRVDLYTPSSGSFIETVDPIYPLSGVGVSTGTVVYQGTNLTLSTTNAGNNIVSTAGITISLPLSTGFSSAFQCQLNAQGGAIILTPQSTEYVQKGSVGASYTLPSGTSAELWTDAAGNWGLNFYTTPAIIQQSVINNSAGGYINKFRNGNFDVAQRGTSGTVTASNTVYTIDGWRLQPSGANLTWSQVYGQILGFSGNFLRINCASGLTQVQFDQPIESFVAASLASQQVTMQFIISNGTSSSIAPQFFVNYANSQDNFSSQTTILTGSFQTIPTNNSVIVSYTFAMPSNASNGIDVAIQFGSGLNAASGNVFIGRADIRATPGVATGLNSTPPVPEVRPIAAELAFCQRYYETSYGNGIAPGTATHAGIPVAIYGAFGVRFSVPKRAAPSISYWDGVGNASKVSQLSATVNSWTDNITPSGAGGFNTPGTTGFSVYLSSLGNVYGFHWSATAEF